MGLIKTGPIYKNYREAWEKWRAAVHSSFDEESKREEMEFHRSVLLEARTYNRGYRDGMKAAKKKGGGNG